MTSTIAFLFWLAILIMSAVIHEISHGAVAEHLGDPTARLAGRLTLNPLKHLDFFGSFLLPALLWLLTGGSIVFGWAKPVPYNPLNLKNPLTGAGKIAAAGPVSNLSIAAIFGIFGRFFPLNGSIKTALVLSIMNPDKYTYVPQSPTEIIFLFFMVIVYTNILLAVFNLVPIPPLDGSKVLFAVLPKNESTHRLVFFLEHYGMLLVLFFIFFGFQLIVPIIQLLFTLIAGQSFGV